LQLGVVDVGKGAARVVGVERAVCRLQQLDRQRGGIGRGARWFGNIGFTGNDA
jgi:hypothetical protein